FRCQPGGPVGPDSPAVGSVLIARSVLTGSHGEEVTGLTVEHSAQRDEGGVPDGSGPVVLEHREIGQGDSDATRQLGQTHLLSPQQGVEVTDHAVRIELLHHHTSPSSSSWAACPERKQRRSRSAPPMIPRTTNACMVVMPGPTALTMPRSNATSLVPMVIVAKQRTAPMATMHSRTPSALIARA